MPVDLMPVQPLGACRLQIAVRHQGALERQAQLAAVCVPGEDHRVAVTVERVEDTQVRRVGDADRQVGGLIRAPATSSSRS